MKLLERTMNSLSVIILVACVGAFALFGLSATGWKALAVPTGSMRPYMSPGSMVFVHRVPISSLRVGDVITYNNPTKVGKTISHRIIKTYLIDGKIPAFVTKGDANKFPDAPIAGGAVIGKVMWHVPHLGSLIIGEKTWASIALVVYLPALFIIIDEFRRLTAYWKSILPYRLYGFWRYKPVPMNRSHAKYAAAGTLAAAATVAGLAFAPSALALLRSNMVTLGPNHITIAASSSGGGGTTCGNTKNNNTVVVGNSSSQSASSGNSSTSGGSGNSASTGNSTNNNTTTTTVTITNGC